MLYLENSKESMTSLTARDSITFSSVQLLSRLPLFVTPCDPMHARPPCPSPTPGVYPNSCPLRWWCHPTISSFVVPFSSRLHSFPASGFFQMSQFFELGGQSREALRESKRGKVMTNLDSIFKSRDITLPTKLHLVKAMVSLVVMYGCESWTIKKAEHLKIDAF